MIYHSQVRVNCVNPTGVATDLIKEDPNSDEAAAFFARTPQKKLASAYV